jgi:outer membrane protein assembly factor BamB
MMVRKLLLAASAVLVLAGCSVFERAERPQTTRGERLPVLAFEQRLEIDPAVAELPVLLPEPLANASWPQAGGSPAKAMQHVVLGDRLQRVWTTSIGDGDGTGKRLLSAPVVADGRLFAIDTRARVSALDANTGGRLWQVTIKRPETSERVAFGGGVSVEGERVIAATGYGVIVALNARTGAELWRRDVGIPLRGSPAIAQGRVFTLSQDNQLFALNLETGEQLWDATAIAENAGILGAAAPAVSGDTVVVGFSSGELNALRSENGRITWQDNLARTGRLTALAALADIDGSPVIDRGRVFALGHGGRMVSLEFTTGERLWERPIGGLNTPWVAGDYLFVVTTDEQVICLLRADGRIRWVTQLQRYEDPDDRDGVVRWQGPVLASDRLIVTSSNGYIATLSPYTGKLISVEQLPDATWLPPVVANTMLYVLTADGRVVAYR